MNTAKKLTLGLLRGSGAVAEFSPLDIAGLVLWLDASDSTTLFQASDGTTPAVSDGDVVGYWGDKSGSGRTATQETTANKPTLQTAELNGENVLRFDGSDDVLLTPSVTLAQPVTILLVHRFSDDVGLRYWIGTGQPVGLLIITNAIQVYAGAAETVGGGVAPNTWLMNTVVMNGADTTGYQNGVFFATVDTGAGGINAVLGVGARGDLAWPQIGDLAELLLYAGALDATQREAIETYLNTKWGIF